MQYSYANQNVSEEFYLYVPQMVLIDIGQTPGDFFFFFFLRKISIIPDFLWQIHKIKILA